jgi:hypothetical protein
MATLYNPALFEEPRNQPMRVAPLLPRETLLSWLENAGRFHANDVDEFQDYKMTEELDDILEAEVYVSDSDNEEE